MLFTEYLKKSADFNKSLSKIGYRLIEVDTPEGSANHIKLFNISDDKSPICNIVEKCWISGSTQVSAIVQIDRSKNDYAQLKIVLDKLIRIYQKTYPTKLPILISYQWPEDWE